MLKKKNQVSKLKGLVEELDIKSNEAIRLNNLNPWTSIWLSGWSDYRERAREREREGVGYNVLGSMAGLGADWGTSSFYSSFPSSSSIPYPCVWLWKWGEITPEDNTSFNPVRELNNTDATCAFSVALNCYLYSPGDLVVKGFFFSFFFCSFNFR